MVGQFKIIKLIGKGGMGEVYLARDTTLGRKVALKIIKHEYVHDNEELTQFMFEAKVTAQFNHPHIITIYEVGEYDGYPYIALEYLQGETLHERLKNQLPGIWESVRISLAISEALYEAHSRKVLHRDLKPENVFLPKDGRLRVLDFGLARFIGAPKLLISPINSSIDDQFENTIKFKKAPKTQNIIEKPNIESIKIALADGSNSATSSVLKGTPPYMAPELWNREEPDEHSDVFSLGVLMYEMATGEKPFHGKSIYSLALDITSSRPPVKPSSLVTIPPSFEALILKCLTKNREHRPIVSEIVRELNQLIASKKGIYQHETNPFRGLKPFMENNNRFFFGRENEINSFLEKVREEPILPVVGPSGAGKSSFIQAGVIPRLKEDDSWIVLTMQPGSDPFRTLSSRINKILTENKNKNSDYELITPDILKENSGKLGLILELLAKESDSSILLVIDQLEELYTHVQNISERMEFMNSICNATDDKDSRIRVILTLRDDFLGNAAENPLTQKILQKVTIIRSPKPSSLKEIIAKPLSIQGYSFDDKTLINKMISKVSGEVSSLPLLQFVLSEMWDGRDKKNKSIKREVYEKIDGVEGALAHHADKTLDGLSPSQINIARKLLMRLVNEDKTRRVITGKRLLQGLSPEASQVLDILNKARLVSVRKSYDEEYEESEFEIIHESLIGKWKRLDNWINEGKIEFSFINELNQAAELWIKRGKRKEEVWVGESLFDAIKLIKRHNIILIKDSYDFIEAGKQLSKEQVLKKRVFQVSGIGILIVIAIVSVIVAVQFSNRKREAVNAEKIALKQEKVARMRWSQAQSEGAKADLANGHIFEAKAKLRVSMELGDSLLARILWWEIYRSSMIWKQNLGATIYEIAFSHDGNSIAAACLNKNIYLFDVKTREITVLQGHKEQVLSLAWSGDDSILVSGSYNGTIGFWDLKTNKRRFIKGHNSRVKSIDINLNRNIAVTAGVAGKIKLWNLNNFSFLKTLSYKDRNWWSIKVSPDGEIIVTASDKGDIVVWKQKSGEVIKVLHEHKGRITSLIFSSDGKLLFSGGIDKNIIIWDTKSWKRIKLLHFTHSINCFDLSRDSKFLLIGNSKKISVWDIRKNKIISEFTAHKARIRSVKFSRDLSMIASAGSDNFIKLWKNKLKKRTPILKGHKNKIVGTAFDPHDKLIASGGGDKNIRIWDIKSGAQLHVLKGHTGYIMGVAWSPDGKYIASSSVDKTIRIWDVKTWKTLKILHGHNNIVTELDFSPDSSMLVSGSLDSTAKIWSVPAGKIIKTLKGHSFHIWSVRFGPKGNLVASGSNDKTIRIWNVADGTTKFILKGHKDAINGLAFSPDGNRLVSGDDDKKVFIWDLKTGKGKQYGEAPGRIYWVDFSSDGENIGISGSGGRFGIWNLSTNSKRFFKGHDQEVNSIKFSHDGKIFVTGSDDGILRVWNTYTLKPLWYLKGIIYNPLLILTQEGWTNPLAENETVKFNKSNWNKSLRNSSDLTGLSLKFVAVSKPHKTELWDVAKDQILKTIQGNHKIVQLSFGFVIFNKNETILYDIHGKSIKLKLKPTAIYSGFNEFLAILKNEIVVISKLGVILEKYKIHGEISTAFSGKNQILIGFKNGNIRLISRKTKKYSSFIFESTPASEISSITEGPSNTIIAGFKNGFVGIWNSHNGSLLVSGTLHGHINKLYYKKGIFIAFAEFGQHLKWDLSVFDMKYCTLMREIWSKVPIIWKSGLIFPQPPPNNHLCNK